MIKPEQLLTLGFYELSPFTGSDKDLRFRIEKKQNEDEKKLIVTIWKGPFAFDHTSDEDKQTFESEFSNEGLGKIADWINNYDKQT